jgi:hypothetical protein
MHAGLVVENDCGLGNGLAHRILARTPENPNLRVHAHALSDIHFHFQAMMAYDHESLDRLDLSCLDPSSLAPCLYRHERMMLLSHLSDLCSHSLSHVLCRDYRHANFARDLDHRLDRWSPV